MHLSFVVKNRTLIGFIALYAIIALSINLSLDLSISNSYQRVIAAGYLSEYIKHDLWQARSLADVKSTFTQGHEHYKLFSGISDWPPLQLALLTIVFILFGVGKAGFIIAPLAITLLALIYLYKLCRLEHNHKTALLATVLAGISTLFFYETAVPMLENGLALFTIACIYHFANYLKTRNPREFHLAAAMFALGFLYKIQMVLILPVLFTAFFWKIDMRGFLKNRKNYRMLALSAALVFLIFIPLIARELALAQEGISVFSSRSVGRLKYIYEEPMRYPGFLLAQDLEFEDQLPQYKHDLILHRYDLSYLQKFVIATNSLFFNFALIPLIFLGLYRLNWRKLSAVHAMIILFVIINLAFFSTHGLIPRYVIPAAALLVIIAAHGISTLPKKTVTPIITLVILITLVQTSLFVIRIASGEHIQSMQHDYNAAAHYMLNNSEGEFTVITTRAYQMAFFVMKQDTERRAYIELAPESKKQFEQMLGGNFSTPSLIEGNTQFSYSTKRPPVRYVVVHEKLETGPLRGIADYSLPEELKRDPRAHLAATIDSPFQNSQTWIYAIS